jgi:hypothetical protein
MKIAAHLQKYRRFESLRQRLDPIDDFELWYWMGLSAGTTLINAALHRVGITEESDRFATQVPDVYAVPDGNGGWRHEIAERCDLIHVGLPALDVPLPSSLDDAFHAMERIERYRDPCVRGRHPITAELVREIERAYAQCTAAARAALGAEGHGGA